MKFITPRRVDLLTGFLAGLFVFCLWMATSDFQASHCKNYTGQESGGHNTGGRADGPTASQHGQGTEPDQERKHGKAEPSFACSALAAPKALMALMDQHEGFFVGGFTFALVVSTLLLWRATTDLYEAGERQIAAATTAANAADRSSKAAIALELPILRMPVPQLWTETFGTSPPKPVGEDAFNHGHLSVPQFAVNNHGRTVALLNAFETGWSVENKLPDVPHYSTRHKFQHEVLAGGQIGFVIRSAVGIGVSGARAKALADGHRTLRVYVRILYEDFMGKEHSAGFCWSWEIAEFVLDRRAPAEYLKKT